MTFIGHFGHTIFLKGSKHFFLVISLISIVSGKGKRGSIEINILLWGKVRHRKSKWLVQSITFVPGSTERTGVLAWSQMGHFPKC